MGSVFAQTVSELALSRVARVGTHEVRRVVWDKVLDMAEEKMGDEGNEEGVIDARKKALRSIATMMDAKESGEDAVSVYRYFYEERLKTVVSEGLHALTNYDRLDKVVLTSDKVKDFSALMMGFISTLQNSESRLLKRFPFPVIRALVETFTTQKDGLQIKRWKDEDNVLIVRAEAKDILDENDPGMDNLIDVCLSVFASGIIHLESFFKSCDSLRDFQEICSNFLNTVKEFWKGECETFPYLSTSEVEELLDLMSSIDGEFTNELLCSYEFQKHAVEVAHKHEKSSWSAGTGKNMLKNLYKFAFKEGNDVLYSCCLPLLKDIAICIRDIVEFWGVTAADEDLKETLKPWKGKMDIALSLVQVLSSDTDLIASSIDIEDTAVALLSRINSEGRFSRKRSRNNRNA